MLVKVNSIAIKGVDIVGVTVEVNVADRGLPHFDIVGLPNKAIEESKQRIKTAFQNSGITFPEKRITVNLAPADLNKQGTFYDLPIAVGIFCALNKIAVPSDSLFYGELSLDGKLRHTKGALLASLYCKNSLLNAVFVPVSCALEASCLSTICVYPVESLLDIYNHIRKEIKIAVYQLNTSNAQRTNTDNHTYDFDFNHIVGQEQGKRALEICAAGGHNIIMMGSPGAGKTLLAKSLVSILPDLAESEAIEVTSIYSSLGKLSPNQGLMLSRPFRAPHHTISYAGMVGGGINPLPGEVTLAHRGVLHMDEFCEFSRPILESLRQPLEDGYVSVSRSKNSLIFPSKFILVASCNPCPCGYFGDPFGKCTCSDVQVSSYRRKLSGPVLDRIDLHLTVHPVETSKLLSGFSANRENSAFVKSRVLAARALQFFRYKELGLLTNSEVPSVSLQGLCRIMPSAYTYLEKYLKKFNFSARTFYKILKVSRTIADLASQEDVTESHVAEALQYRVNL